MNKDLYDMIYKRKSFHLFRNIGNEHITQEELDDIEKEFPKFKPLVSDIKVKIRIVKKESILRSIRIFRYLFDYSRLLYP